MLNTFFDFLGLNNKEISIYTYLLSYWPQVASVIAKKNDVKRVSIYPLLKSMVDRWFLVDYNKNKLTYFKAIEPEDILSMFEKKESEFNKLKKWSNDIYLELETIKQNQVKEHFDLAWKISYYEWIDAVSWLIEETLEEPVKEQLCFWLNEYHTKIHKDDRKDYTNTRVEKWIKVKSIQPDTKAAIDYANRDEKELRETKLVSKEDFPAYCELNIMWDMIALFTTKWDKPSGMKMYNKYMADTLRSLFKLAREKSDKN